MDDLYDCFTGVGRLVNSAFESLIESLAYTQMHNKFAYLESN